MPRFLLLVLLGCACHAQAQEGLPSFAELEAQGAVIGEIRVNTHNIFDLSDPTESSFFYRAANALRIKTRPWFIRRYLLFKRGDFVQVRLTDETERLIRQNSTVYEVEIGRASCRERV